MTFQKNFIAATRPARYLLESTMYRMMADKGPLLALKDKYAGQPMLVVGNGPSLNKTPLDDFAGVPSIGMNKIDMIYPRTIWRPSVIVCLNNLVAQQHQDQFAESSVPLFVAWKARWLIRRENRRRLNYFNSLSSSEFSKDVVRGFGSSATVTYVALQMAYWMGADPVILFGVDHSFSYSGPAATYQKRTGPDLNHFDQSYFKHGTYWGTPDLQQSEIAYGKAREAFRADGRRVLDATIGGKLSIFEKIPLSMAREISAGAAR